MIRYLSNKEIDRHKWQQCVVHAQNTLIYAQDFVLDAFCEDWDALVLNDYEAVMPLPLKRKYLLSYVTQPYFLQQLGIFYTKEISKEIFDEFLARAKAKFRFISTNLNASNIVYAIDEKLGPPKTNYVLPLPSTELELNQNLSPDFLRSYRRARNKKLQFNLGASISMAIQYYQATLAQRQVDVGLQRLQKFAESYPQFVKRYSVSNGAGEVLAISLLLNDGKRLYNVLSAATSSGRKVEANYFLYYNILVEHLGKQTIFDFEGSNIEGVARFYQKFNPVNEPYVSFNYKRFF